MAEEWDYGNNWGASYDPWYPDAGGSMGNTAWEKFTGWGDPYGPGSSGDTSYGGEGGGGNWWQNALSTLGGLSGVLGPALGAAGSLAGGAIGSNAASDASRLQSQALNRGIDLQTAQWLQQQGNLAPYLQAGQQGLSQLQQLAGREQPALPGANAAVRGQDYGLPGAVPNWSPHMFQGPSQVHPDAYRWTPQAGPEAWRSHYEGPQAVQAQGYTWTPGQGPQAQDYRYTPGQTPDAAQYQSGPPQLYQGAMPGTQVSSLTGQQVLDQDPGAAFRQSEARKALEGSAAARGDLLSGGTLQALQSRSQDLASQEYGNAFNRMMQRDVEQYGRNWGQYQQAWNQGVQGTQLGLQTNAQNFGQAMSASQLREQVNQQAQQMGWNQAQTEAVFREQMAQQSQAQNFGQALGAQGQQFQQGLAGSQYDWQRAQQEAAFRESQGQLSQQQAWQQALGAQQNAYQQGLSTDQWNTQQYQNYDQQQYARMMEQAKLRYGQGLTENQTTYDRQQALYRQQLGQHLLPWEQNSTLANLGGQAVGMYGNQGQSAANSIATLLGRQGEAQGMAPAASGLSWQRALTGATNQVPSLLASLNA